MVFVVLLGSSWMRPEQYERDSLSNKHELRYDKTLARDLDSDEITQRGYSKAQFDQVGELRTFEPGVVV